MPNCKPYSDVTETLGTIHDNNEEREAIEYLEYVASSIDTSYDDLLYYAKNYLENGSYYICGSECENFSMNHEKFWNAYELVENTKVDNHDRDSFISCGC